LTDKTSALDLEDISMLTSPDENLVRIMNDGVIYRNAIKQVGNQITYLGEIP